MRRSGDTDVVENEGREGSSGNAGAAERPLAQVEHLTRIIETRAQKTVILDDVTFSVPAHSLFAINGPSGSGKSTILNMLTGLDRPTSGRVLFAGEELRARSENALAQAGLDPSVSTAAQQISRNQNQFQILYILLYAVAAIVALVGILGLFNTLTTSVLERRREIGILRSMGATGARVAGVFWTEGMALAALSWGVAVLLGIPAAYGFVTLISNVLLPIPFAFNPLALLVMVFTLGIATLASLIPVLSAARVRIAVTLRYE